MRLAFASTLEHHTGFEYRRDDLLTTTRLSFSSMLASAEIRATYRSPVACCVIKELGPGAPIASGDAIGRSAPAASASWLPVALKMRIRSRVYVRRIQRQALLEQCASL